MLCAIDPGNFSGVALFANGGLVAVYLHEQDPNLFDLRWRVDRLVIEVPFITPKDCYPSNSKRINDLLKVVRSVERWIGRIGASSVHEVHPHDWKGSVPKEIHNERVLARLSAIERGALRAWPKSKQSNPIDAIGLGLFELGRMGRGA